MVESLPVPGGRIERLVLPGGPGVPLLVVGGVETGLRLLAGTEALLARRWEGRRAARTVIVVGRTVPDDPSDANALLHPRVSAAAITVAITAPGAPYGRVAIQAESGGGRISLWLTVDHPAIVLRLVLAASAAETPTGSGWRRVCRSGSIWVSVGSGVNFPADGAPDAPRWRGWGRPAGWVVRRGRQPPAGSRHPGSVPG